MTTGAIGVRQPAADDAVLVDPLATELEVWVSPRRVPVALRYTRPAVGRAWTPTGLVGTWTGSGSIWSKTLPWRELPSPAQPGALLWTRPPTVAQVAAAYDDGQLVDLLTARRRGLPVQPVPEAAGPGIDPSAPRLAQVAAVYTSASTQGRPPVLAVAEHFGIVRTKAGNWVTAARAAGHLPATTKGRAT